MKHRLKGLLALVLSLVMVLALATNAWATVWINNVELKQENNYSVKGTNDQGTATYDPATSTLTLNNFVYNGADGITATGNLTLVLEGDNTITNANGDGIVVSSGTLTITSSDDNATLGVSGTDKGIYAWSGGSVVISGGTVTARATNNTSGIGIEATDSITIGGAKNPTVEVGCATGLKASTVNILENSTVNITTNATTSTDGKTIDCTNLYFDADTSNLGTWYQWSENGGPVNISSNTNQLTVDAAKGIQTLTIGKIVQAPTYTVTFDGNGAPYGTMTDLVVAEGEGDKVTLTKNAFERNGYTFAGWNTKADGTGDAYADEAEITVDENITLYAQWTENSTGGPGSYWSGPNTIFPDDSDKSATKTESPKTFDGGIASAVVVTILSATGGAWLAKKKD